MSVTTINTEMGHFDFQKNGVTITLTGAGTVASPWVCNISGIPTGSGTDNHIVRWDGTGNIQDSVWTIADTTGAMSGGASVQVSDGSDTVAMAAFPNPIVQLGDGTATMTTTLGSLAYDDGTNVGDLVFSAITGTRAWTLPDLTGTVLLDTTPYADFPAATEGQIIDFGGGSGAARATDSPKIGGDTRIYLDVRAQGEYLFYDSDSTGLGVTSWTEATPATTNGGQAELQLDGIVANAGNAEVWFRLGALPADWQGRNWRFTGLGYKIQKVAGDNTEVYAGLYAEVMDSGAATADWTVVDALLGPVATGAAPLWEEGVLTPTPAAVGNGPLWLRIQITADAADVGNLVRIRVYPGAFYISGDTL